MSESDKVRATRLEIRDVLGIRELDVIFPAGEAVSIFGGPNGGGKSSALTALLIAMVDAGGHPSAALRSGASKGVVRVTFDDGLTVTRMLRRGKAPQLEVLDGNGEPMGKGVGGPQRGVLDKLWSKFTWDPTEALRLPDAELRQHLMRLGGVDWTDLDAEAKRVYTGRTVTNRQVDTARAQLAGMPEHPDAPAELVDTEALMAELRRRQEHNREGDELTAAYEKAATDAENYRVRLEELQRELQDLQKRIKRVDGYRQEAQKAARAAEAARAEYEPANVAEVEQQLAQSRETNAAVLANKQRAAKAEELATLEAESAAATARLKAIDAEKQTQLEAAKFPIKGLSFSDEGVLYRGLPFAQAEESARLRVAVAIGMRLNPRLKTMICRYGGGLDDAGIELLKQIVAEEDGQLLFEHPWVPAEKCRAYIREGRVVGGRQLELGK